MEDMLVHSMSG